jgi:uncharacterized membrane protein
LNLFLIGGIGNRVLSDPDVSSGRDRSARPFPPGIGWVLRDLPDERRAEFEDFLQQSATQLDPARSEMFASMRKANELMASSDFNSEELAIAFADLRESNNRYQALSHEDTVQLLSQLTEEERQTALEFVQRGGPRGMGGRRSSERRPPD